LGHLIAPAQQRTGPTNLLAQPLQALTNGSVTRLGRFARKQPERDALVNGMVHWSVGVISGVMSTK
jgi:hypothetical protein